MPIPEQLLATIRKSGRQEIHFKSLMGSGYHKLADALEGKPLDIWGAKHVEWGLSGRLPDYIEQPAPPTPEP